MQDLDFSHLEPLDENVEVAPPAVVVTRDQMAGARVYHLLVPLTLQEAGKNRRLRSIRMRHPSQAEIDAWGRGEIDGNRALMCALTGQPPEVIGGLAWPDASVLHLMMLEMVPDFVAEFGK